MNDEIWKDIEGYEGIYQVSNKGDIKSLDRTILRKDGKAQRSKGRTLSQALQKENQTNNYYKIVLLSKNGIQKRCTVHRLVAKAFVSNPENKKVVNHIDGNKGNNNCTNLEWVSDRENKLHSFRTLKENTIKVINTNTNEINTYSNLAEAFESIEIDKSVYRKIQYHVSKYNKYLFKQFIFYKIK